MQIETSVPTGELLSTWGGADTGLSCLATGELLSTQPVTTGQTHRPQTKEIGSITRSQIMAHLAVCQCCQGLFPWRENPDEWQEEDKDKTYISRFIFTQLASWLVQSISCIVHLSVCHSVCLCHCIACIQWGMSLSSNLSPGMINKLNVEWYMTLNSKSWGISDKRSVVNDKG